MKPSPFFKLNTLFWQADRQAPFTAHETRLFFYLLNVANEAGWPGEFTHADSRTCGNVSMSANGMKKCRDRLIETGLLSVETGGKGKGDAARYRFRCHEVIAIVTPIVIPNLTPKESLVSPKVSPHDTYTMYKRLKTFYTLSKGSVRKKIVSFRLSKKRQRKAPLIPRVPPKPIVPVRPMWQSEPFTLKSDSERVNVPFSAWYPQYQFDANETECRRAWLQLSNAERLTAQSHTPLYVLATPKRWRKAPLNYLQYKNFNDEIINRHETNAKPQPRSGQREIIRTTYTHERFKPASGNIPAAHKTGAGSADAA